VLWEATKLLLFSKKNDEMRWARHIARIRRRGMHIAHWRESQKERDHYEDQDIGVWIILKRILVTGCGCMDLTDLVQGRDRWRVSEHGNELVGSITRLFKANLKNLKVYLDNRKFMTCNSLLVVCKLCLIHESKANI
jgi:hypothetical protein